MRNTSIYTALSCVLLLSSCTNTEDPQLAMCQAVTKQLLGDTVSNWDNINQTDKKRVRSIEIAFTQADGTANKVNCGFPIKENGDVDTAPSTVTLNDEQLEKTVLLKAGLKASGALLKGTAANTVAKSKELAADAAVKAREGAADATKMANEVADKAKEGAQDAKVIASELADKAKVGAQDAKVIASELADKAKEGVSQMAGEVTEKAREKALEATELLQKKLDN